YAAAAHGPKAHDHPANGQISWFTALHTFLQNLQTIETKDQGKADFEESKKKYYFDEIERATEDLSFPRLSQLRWIDALVALSYKKLKSDPDKLNDDLKSLSKDLEALVKAEKPLKTGGDCAAPIMQVQ